MIFYFLTVYSGRAVKVPDYTTTSEEAPDRLANFVARPTASHKVQESWVAASQQGGRRQRQHGVCFLKPSSLQYWTMIKILQDKNSFGLF